MWTGQKNCKGLQKKWDHFDSLNNVDWFAWFNVIYSSIVKNKVAPPCEWEPFYDNSDWRYDEMTATNQHHNDVTDGRKKWIRNKQTNV